MAIKMPADVRNLSCGTYTLYTTQEKNPKFLCLSEIIPHWF